MRYIKKLFSKEITFKEWLEEDPKYLGTLNINCSNCNLIDLNGIEEFKELEYLNCAYNRLTELPDLSNLKKLEELNCSYNNLTHLPDLSDLKKLTHLYCYNNKLIDLPDLRNIIYLDCSSNKLPFDCSKSNDIYEYIEWHKKEYPWIWDAKKYNL
jgi:Leucine-rich repeat (LRR) protein